MSFCVDAISTIVSPEVKYEHYWTLDGRPCIVMLGDVCGAVGMVRVRSED